MIEARQFNPSNVASLKFGCCLSSCDNIAFGEVLRYRKKLDLEEKENEQRGKKEASKGS